CILIHYKQGVPGLKREEHGMIVYMSENQFNSFRNVTDLHLPLCYYRTVNFETKSEFKTIVGMTFEDFSKFVKKLYHSNADNSESTTNSGVL
ncbi:hypothetical protein RZS08_41885, partial [Arthrospira platensis SPKY1]|nr:hypothetical protein [Arthrospira platensis SPKY1]